MPFVDGLRGVTAVFVVLHHFYLISRGGIRADALPMGLFTNWLLYGHLAVDVFIVLSGFCLTLPLLSRPDSRVPFVPFIRRRFRRIVPPYMAALVLSLCLSTSMNGAPWLRSVAVNVLMIEDWLPEHNVLNAPFWSVAAEIKIYLFFPLLIVLFRSFGVFVSIASAVTLALLFTVVYLYFMNPDFGLGHSCPWYIALFALGIAAAIRSKAKASGPGRVVMLWTVIFAVLSATLLFIFPINEHGEDEAFVLGLPYIDVSIGALVSVSLYGAARRWWAGLPAGLLVQVLSTKLARFFGTFAFSIYLTHFPIGLITFQYLQHRHLQGRPLTSIMFLAVLPCSLVIAYLFFWMFERPFLTGAHKRIATKNATEKLSV